MDLSRIVLRGSSCALLVMVSLFFAMACGGSAATDEEPELTLEQLIESGGEKLAAVSTAKFQMIDEMQSGPSFWADVEDGGRRGEVA